MRLSSSRARNRAHSTCQAQRMEHATPVTRGRLVIVSGLPGSGKTMLAKHLEHDLRALRLAPDEWMADLGVDLYDAETRERIEQLQWRLAQRLLVLGSTVIIEWGTWARTERDTLRERAREIGAAVELRFLDAPLHVLWARIRDRDIERELGHRPYTLADLNADVAMIERPDAEERALFDSPP